MASIAKKREDLSDFDLPTSEGYLPLDGEYPAELLEDDEKNQEGFDLKLTVGERSVLAYSVDFDFC